MTNETKNEVVEVEQNEMEVIKRETDDYVVVQTQDGKFKRKAKYNEYSSIVPQTREEKIWLMNLLEGEEESGNGLKDCVSKVIEVQDIITRTYDKIDEDTGEMNYGVLTYLITPKKEVYVTSSKNVYFTITRLMQYFGKPTDPEWENIKVKVGKEKGTNGDIIKIKMVG